MSDKRPANMNESYENAVSALLSPLHQATTPAAIRTAAARRKNTLHDMHTYLHRLGLNLNGSSIGSTSTTTTTNAATNNVVPSLILHVTGTKGKGSTLSTCESILRNAYGLNTGMFTSPHLVSIRERIRINGVPVSKEVFGQVYWRVRRQLEQFHDVDDAANENDSLPTHNLPVLPGYFRMITLMALYTFCHYENPKIDAILLEVGMGGRYDATNVFEQQQQPAYCCSSQIILHDEEEERILIRGVTLIDYDHTRVLGSTLEQIAWEKGGIFVRGKLINIGINDGGYDRYLEGNVVGKDEDEQRSNKAESTSLVFASGNNTAEVLNVLHHIAVDNDYRLEAVHDSYMESFPDIGLQGDHQRSNAALALAMCQYAMNRYQTSRPSHGVIQWALAKTFWPGRCHTVSLPCLASESGIDHHAGLQLSMNLRCDGAHTPISINACIDWYRTVSTSNSLFQYNKIYRVLVFNCSHERNPLPLLFSLYHSDLFHSIYFCRADFERPSAVPKRLEEGWMKEPLGGGIAGSLKSMCDELVNTTYPNNGGSTTSIILDSSKLSASTWQETLANVLNVFDAHRRHVSERSLTHPAMKVTKGLNVKDALLAIQKDAVLFAAHKIDGDVAADDEQRVLIEACVTGSLYIVGSALEAAGWEEGEASGNISS
ncbi:hypothetical protein ACHAXR_007933 [Thalassiosira sp. AJA248-18]